jgi:hypothetical protein
MAAIGAPLLAASIGGRVAATFATPGARGDTRSRPLDPWAYKLVVPGARRRGGIVRVRTGTVVPAKQGFDWQDAGIGAAAGAGLVLLLLGAVLLIRRTRTRPQLT